MITEPDTPLNNADHVGSFNLLGVQLVIEKEHQEPLSIEEQVENLISLGLTVEDKEHAKAFLNDVSYFRLIKAYSLGLKPKNGQYNEGVTFSQIEQLYKFNCNFRQLCINLIAISANYCLYSLKELRSICVADLQIIFPVSTV